MRQGHLQQVSGVRLAGGATAGRLSTLALLMLALAFLVAVSLAAGASGFSPSLLLKLVALRPDFSDAEAALVELRTQRTLLAVVAGLSLGLSGALMQAITRNPLADPGVLGINAGAALGVVAAIGLFGPGHENGLVGFAFCGAALAALVVHAISRAGPDRLLPARMTLAGVAATALLGGVTAMVVLADPVTFDRMRGWTTGSLAAGSGAGLAALAPFVACGAVLAFATARTMNVLELGDDVARSFGANLTRARLAGGLAATLLAAAATAGAGPVAFVGLMVPHIARRAARADQRWTFAFALPLGPVFLLSADILGRLVMAPAEVPAGIAVAVAGAPAFILLTLRGRDEAA